MDRIADLIHDIADHARKLRRTWERRYEALWLESQSRPPIPPCAATMGCLCAGHARGNDANAPCDTRETPSVTTCRCGEPTDHVSECCEAPVDVESCNDPRCDNYPDCHAPTHFCKACGMECYTAPHGGQP
jgi:hypothetical protein